ncbi:MULTISPECIES: ribbon-helix-helix protein, CopG family [unclassified Sulfurospirillum]|uniref:ribbon-helix-helix protein, CopG family n=1 Tax=unclassified Sulfurospirillum TaxID=2618290 RepID=UPI00050875BA|nr:MULTISPECIES: ribbon-helix-helix protein, CopG family [unclassified Sulfurospirillum]KFL34446.1 CopG family transcriptional regulator [Sulfurospirillum sp. SCADC]
MTATVRLDEALELKLERMAKTLHKKKSDVIRDAIDFYASSVESEKKSRILLAVEKTKEADKALYTSVEGTLNDGL